MGRPESAQTPRGLRGGAPRIALRAPAGSVASLITAERAASVGGSPGLSAGGGPLRVSLHACTHGRRAHNQVEGPGERRAGFRPGWRGGRPSAARAPPQPQRPVLVVDVAGAGVDREKEQRGADRKKVRPKTHIRGQTRATTVCINSKGLGRAVVPHAARPRADEHVCMHGDRLRRIAIGERTMESRGRWNRRRRHQRGSAKTVSASGRRGERETRRAACWRCSVCCRHASKLMCRR